MVFQLVFFYIEDNPHYIILGAKVQKIFYICKIFVKITKIIV